MKALAQDDSDFLRLVRAGCILVIVLSHVGVVWFWPPYSQVLQVANPIFFFMSGAVGYYAFARSPGTGVYLNRRLVQLLVPYYLFCLFVLGVHVLETGALPSLSVANLVRWLTVTPSQELMPFPLGQLWFLHTLAVITLLSPLLFRAYDKARVALWLVMAGALLASIVQLRWNLAGHLQWGGHNLFRPLVHGLFYCLGFHVYDRARLRSKGVLWTAAAVSAAGSAALVAYAGVSGDYSRHVGSPDLYLVLGGVGSVSLLLLCSAGLVRLLRAARGGEAAVRFLFTHTFSIYLVHTFAIFAVEQVLGLGSSRRMTLVEGGVKLVLVLLLTLALAPLLTKAASAAVEGLALKRPRARLEVG
jgi:peptidoglycan/LPS O-acetylase OafA/YrhL